MNILILGTGNIEQALIKLCRKSKHLNHLYTASNKPLEDVPNIEYNDYEDLARKAKALQVDVILTADNSFIEVVDFFKKNFLNIFSVNSKWFNLESSRLIAKQLMNYYSINNPEVIKAPLVYPIVVKTDKPFPTKIAYTLEELVEIKENIRGEKVFLEEYLKGEAFNLLSLWDGKNLASFIHSEQLTEVQADRLDLYKTKLNIMLSEEKADFIGFFTSKLIWAKNDWYVLEYIMHLNEKSDLSVIKSDFLYLLNSAIYQKLNEI